MAEMGRELRQALQLAGCDPASVGYKAGLPRTDRALARFADAVTLTNHLPDVARIANERATGRHAPEGHQDGGVAGHVLGLLNDQLKHAGVEAWPAAVQRPPAERKPPFTTGRRALW